MKIESQVVSIELARELKSLGVKQESLFWWGEYEDLNPIIENARPKLGNSYSAFTVAELGEMLPYQIELDGKYYCLCSTKDRDVDWLVFYREFGDGDIPVVPKYDKSEANARAAMLCYLIKQGIVKPEGVGR